ncbi:MAG TPA: hypothetical protein VMU48_06940 [Terracidiphilus sp.]|nr:hypothetical protein [Terracidiphilus sp.]
MGHKTIAMTAGCAHLASTLRLQALDPGSSGAGLGSKWPRIGYWSKNGHSQQKTE